MASILIPALFFWKTMGATLVKAVHAFRQDGVWSPHIDDPLESYNGVHACSSCGYERLNFLDCLKVRNPVKLEGRGRATFDDTSGLRVGDE